MGTAVTRNAYFRVGIGILADLGYGGLKLAEVCHRVGVTTGSFYHYFNNWAEYTHELIEHWLTSLTQERMDALADEADPYRRIDLMMEVGLGLPFDAYAAVRAWSSVDARVRNVVVSLDAVRYDIVHGSALEILGDERQADAFAKWALYLLVGYEQSTLPRDHTAFTQLTTALFRRILETGDMAVFPD
ncbi:MAG: TetR/AcrR family transcriptional regulator [Mycobacterium sp.]